jgi:gliding motility-associated-like protein
LKGFNPIIKLLFILSIGSSYFAQTLIINEVSQGPSGNQEYIEFIVVDDNAFYNCGNSTPPCVDIRGWIIDDNSGYHGAGGVAPGCNRFSFNSFWQCIPLGTIILVYNDADANPDLPPIDTTLSDNNCRLVIPINNTQLFETNPTTPGAIACSYPANGWSPGGNWNTITLANSGDCARLVNLSGCEVSSLCWAGVNQNTQIYFASGGSGTDNVWYFNEGNSMVQSNWVEACADNETILDAGTCGANNQTPGASNSSLNSAYIAQFNNNCQPIQPLALSVIGTNSQSCSCDGSVSISTSGSIGPYTYAWFDNFNIPLGQSTPTATNLCSGNYYCVVTSSIDCVDTIPVFIGTTCSNYGTFASATMIQNCVNNQFYNTTWANLPDQINPNGVLFDAYNYGPFFQNSNTLILRGGEVKTFKNPGANVCGAKLYYTVYPVGNQPANPLFTILDLPFKESCSVGPSNFPTGGPCFNASDQKWAKENYNIDLTTYPPGNYVIEVYYAVPGSYSSTTACNDTIYVNNNGNNYKALFQIKPQPLISGGPLAICPGNTATLTSNYISGNSWNASSTNQSISVTNTGLYTLTVDLGNNCPNLSDNESVTVYSSPTVEAGTNQSTCGTNSITLTGSIGGSATGSLWISPSGTFSNSTSLTTTFTPTITSGIATVILSASGPCPTVQDQLIVIVNSIPTVSAGNDQTVCAGQSVNLTGAYGGSATSSNWSAPLGTFSSTITTNTTYTPTIASGNVTLTLTASGPCPSISDQIIINVNAPTIPTFSQVAPICNGETFSIPTTSLNGITGTWSPVVNNSSTTTYTFTPNVGQCASTSTMTVVVKPNFTVSINQTVCSNQIPFVWNGLIFNGPGAQTANLTSVNGCDSIVSLTLAVSNVISSTTNLSICQNELPYLWNGITLNGPGSQAASLTSVAGCDSIAIINLTVNSPQTSLTNLTICTNQLPFTWNSLIFNGSGIQSVTLQSISGCDSTATLNLSVLGTLTSTSVLSICPNEFPYFWNGLQFDNPGTQTASLISISGCDSLATLNLIELPSYIISEPVTICSNETPFSWNGFNFTTSATQTIALQSISGCDSTVTLNLTVLPSYEMTIDSTICENDLPFSWNGISFNSSGTQTFNFLTINGCDSILSMTLTIDSWPQLIGLVGGNTYCEGDSPTPIFAELNGESPFTISYTINGMPMSNSSNSSQINLGNSEGIYSIISVTDNNCTNSPLNQSQIIEIFPNPPAPLTPGDSSYCLNSVIDSIEAIVGLGANVVWFNSIPLQSPIATSTSILPEMTLGSTTYYVTQEIDGCTSSPNAVTINFEICDIIIPTAFTPDGDNTNDFWDLGNIDELYPRNLVTIYNRWGNLIYQSLPGKYQSNPWYGTYNDELMPVGSYYYIIEFGETYKGSESGIITIVK